MNCDEVRNLLLDATASPRKADDPSDHLERCAPCADYAARLARTVRRLADHRTMVEPDAGFAARVVAALPAGRPLIARFALRLLPAALALALVLGGWVALEQRRHAVAEESAPSDDLLGWVLQEGENGS